MDKRKGLVTITTSIDQADIIAKALDFYSRIHMGQLNELLMIPIPHKDKPIEQCVGYNRGVSEDLIKMLKKDLTGMTDAYWSITSNKLPDYVKIAADIKDVITHEISKATMHDKWDISFDKPFHYNKKVPLINVQLQ